MRRTKTKRQFGVNKLLIRWSAFRPVLDIKNRQFQVWLITFFYISLMLTLFFGPVLRVKNIACTTNHQPQCPDFIVPELSKYLGQIIYILPKKDISDRIHKNTPLAQNVTIIPHWPDTVEAKITWQEPMVQVAIPASSSAYLVTATGHIVGVTDTTNPAMPLIVAQTAVDLVISDQLTDPSLLGALTAIKGLSGSKHAVRSVEIISPLELITILQSGQRVLMTSTKDMDSQVRALQLILAPSTMNPADQTIDLRPERPVMKPVQ